MAVIQVHQKHLAITCATILACLLVYKANLASPGGPLNKVTQTGRHSHFLDYDFFSFYPSNGILLSTSTEVPRNILGTEIRYILNNPICDSVVKTENPQVFMLVLITSYLGDVKLRRKLREILPQSQLDEIKVKRLFLLAKPPPRYQVKDSKYADVNMKQVIEENQEFQDLLMGDFTESYKSLTYKHLMGLEWAATFCQNAMFVLKQDDDIIVDYFQLHHLLTSEKSKLGEKITNPLLPTIYGKILDNQRVERNATSKWYVPVEEYHDATYPPYVSGWAYVTTIPAIQEILQASLNSKYFFIDDAFVTGILREKTSVSLMDMKDHFTHYKGQILCCVSVPMFLKSKNNEPFWCDYLVGPSNDDLELMEIYQRHSEYCYVSKMCRRREEHEMLHKRCVITGNMKVQDFSQLQSQGKAKPLAVIRKQ